MSQKKKTSLTADLTNPFQEVNPFTREENFLNDYADDDPSPGFNFETLLTVVSFSTTSAHYLIVKSLRACSINTESQ